MESFRDRAGVLSLLFSARSAGVRRAHHLLTAIVVAAAWCAAVPDAGAQSRSDRRVSEDLARKLRAGDYTSTSVIFTGTQAEVDGLVSRHGLTVKKRLRSGAVLEVGPGKLADVAADRSVNHLSGNHAVFTQMDITNQTIGADQVQEGLLAAGVPGLTGKGVGVAVIDSGVAPVPELKPRIVASLDFTDDKGHGRDEHGHGTHVAGIIGASGVNTHDDTRGVAPGAHIVSLKVLDAEGRGTVGDVIEAIDWAIEHRTQFNIRVMNLSLGGPVLQSWRDDPLCQAVERAYRAGIVVVASAGNFGKTAEGVLVKGGITVPGNSPFAITVGALNTKGTPGRWDDVVASYSSNGPTHIDKVLKPDLIAPGNRIRGLISPGSTLLREHPELVVRSNGERRIELSGTSMAAAVVSGSAALLIDALGSLSPIGVRVLFQLGSEAVEGGLVRVGAGSISVPSSLLGPGSRTVLIAGQEVVSQRLVFADTALLADQTVVWGESDETVVWGESDTVVWGEARTVVWGEAGTVVWGEARTVVWGEADTVVWGEARTVVWGESDTVVWGESDETVVWGESDETVVWGESDTVVWGESDTVVWGESDTVVWGESDTVVWGESDTVVWGETDTVVWGESDETVVWGESDTVVWGE